MVLVASAEYQGVRCKFKCVVSFTF